MNEHLTAAYGVSGDQGTQRAQSRKEHRTCVERRQGVGAGGSAEEGTSKVTREGRRVSQVAGTRGDMGVTWRVQDSDVEGKVGTDTRPGR